ncbi:cytochrome P450 6g1-like isoform X1 [Bactrocera tryoni]|uniref:cytochrome P450 6g1-like isoform X1 n=2 Tax=Bactrocera tryoni TaxID=59916 RepID=UPI001A956D65|nr:cytochrome P450 6g1-like isoform X1 [Bactrocera tryoni]
MSIQHCFSSYILKSLLQFYRHRIKAQTCGTRKLSNAVEARYKASTEIYIAFINNINNKGCIMLSADTACLLVTLLALAYVWCRYTYGFWKRNKIPYMTPLPLIGNMEVLFTMSNSFYLYLSDIYKDARMSKAAAVGIYILNRPALVLREPELIKHVLIKEFPKFANRSGGCDPHDDPLGSNNLFLIRNPQWKDLRTKITPIFTTGKIKQMYPLMTEIGTELEAHLNSYAKNDDAFVTEIKEVCALFTTDMIATIAYGVKANSLANPNGEFRSQGRKLLTFTLSRAKDFFVIFFFPKWASTFRAKFFTTEFSAFLRGTIGHVMALREESKATRNDLIDVLLSLKEEAVAKGEYNAHLQDILTAQAAVFFSAGFETSSSTMTFALYELSKRLDLQERLRNEICEAFVAEQGTMSYETINNLPYLSMVVDEVLRLYPVLPFLDREYLPKEGEKQFDLKPYYDYTIPVGMPVYIPIFAIQRDPEFWPNPNTFDPERFNAENKKTHKPMSYLPFGSGPRNCIGGRIGLLQSKVGLVHILKNHYVTTCEKTPSEITFDPLAIVLSYKKGIYLKLVNDKRYERLAKQ